MALSSKSADRPMYGLSQARNVASAVRSQLPLSIVKLNSNLRFPQYQDLVMFPEYFQEA